ncbi:aminoglycoside phosphotransferase [Kitasatospora sp. MMS16-BH015]|uniref:phosphotransferase n=1 Tax=Kitasatospora sp. MMS16-BH015 TaxID=2018025 RepID=UPI000CA1B970|nr:phosphotransferase [Kitasatospora sp. MMS16-BH015]AUG75740.1 aminoglycoside phosphotransferase [Kitasatospora sp. MMS16-BH015]
MITRTDDPRLVLARRSVGPVTIIAEPGLPDRVLHLADSRGTRYFAKQHHQPARFTQEVNAYAGWARHLAARTPDLVAQHHADLVLLITAVPGRRANTLPPGSDAEQLAHRAAGAALRALHTATAITDPDLCSKISSRLRTWIAKAHQAELLSAREHQTLSEAADQLTHQRMEAAVCHLDYQPRNWCVGKTLAVVDFEHSRPDARIRDLARLAFRHWPRSPHLRQAFLSGYGCLTSVEENLLHLFAAYEAVTALVRGHENADRDLSAHGRATLARLLP